jgi:osmoprotectant transport system permease protein
VSALADLLTWLTEAANWSGSRGIPVRVYEHVQLSGLATVLAAAVALPAGFYIGHARRFELAVMWIANLGRAIPSFAILAGAFYVSVSLGFGVRFWPTFVALFVLAIPPMLTNAYVGVREVDPDALESARGMGMTGREVLFLVEVPLAVPLMVAGIKTAAVQVVATATLGAVAGAGGLGRFILDGFATGQRGPVLGGALLVALLAIGVELGLGAIERRMAPGAERRRRPARREYESLAQVGRPGGI